MLDFLVECARAAGAVLEEHRHRLTAVRTKESPASVVSEADLAAEHCLFERLRGRFPEDGFLGEETGLTPGRSGRTWVVDPLDGTSNYVAGLPWFGVMIACLEEQAPARAVLYLPALNRLYTAERGRGARGNGEPLSVTAETELARVLIGFGLDGTADTAGLRRQGLLLAALAQRSRNLRATNSLVDFCLTAEGRLGGTLNFACKLWDLAAPALLVREAGGLVTDLAGREPDFRLDAAAATRTHTVLAAAPAIHRQLLAVTQSAGPFDPA
jgi:myo-inositol-1(or 4)-monophosphatase